MTQDVFFGVITNEMLWRAVDDDTHGLFDQSTFLKVVGCGERADQGTLSVTINDDHLCFLFFLGITPLVLSTIQFTVNQKVAEDSGWTPHETVRPTFDAFFYYRAMTIGFLHISPGKSLFWRHLFLPDSRSSNTKTVPERTAPRSHS